MFVMKIITPFVRALTLLAFAMFLVPSVGLAQTSASQSAANAALVSCNDYYHFGSVQAHLSPSSIQGISGAPISFTGTLDNANPYPVVDGTLYVKVFKDRVARDANGPDVVDEFAVKSGISIPAKGSVPISFDWNVPSYAQGGNYSMASYFITSSNFNLLGLSFTDDVTGSAMRFKVTGEQSSGVAFNKAGVKINDQTYRFAASRMGGRRQSAPVSFAPDVRLEYRDLHQK